MKGEFTRIVVGFILMSCFVGCGKPEDTELLYSEETPTNTLMESDSVKENETIKTIEISCEGTVFSYNGNDYEITERNKFVYSIW